MLGKNPHQRELPLSNKITDAMAQGARAFKPLRVQHWLASRLRPREAWVNDATNNTYACSLDRYALVGTDEQITAAAKTILGGRLRKEQDVAVEFATSTDKPPSVTIRISNALYRAMVCPQRPQTPDVKGRVR